MPPFGTVKAFEGTVGGVLSMVNTPFETSEVLFPTGSKAVSRMV
jgi:hypothetical protein